MEILSTTQENQLLGAIKTAVNLVEQGQYTPDQAIIKVANDSRWGPDMIRFAAHAYNTGRQTAQRETSTGVLDKLATFSLVDPEKIIQQMWPSKVKTALELNYDGVSAEYDGPPTFLMDIKAAQQRQQWVPPAEKVAAVVAQEPPETVSSSLAKQARYQRELSESQRQYSDHVDRLRKLAGSLGYYFQQPELGRLKFAELESCVVANLSAGEKFLDYVYNTFKLKEARATDRTFAVHDEKSPPWQIVKQAVDLGVKAADLQQQMQQIKQAAAELRQNYEATFLPKKSQPQPAVGPIWMWLEEKRAGGLLGGALLGSIAASGTRGLLDNTLGSTERDRRVDREVENLSDPNHEDELRQIRAQALLSELMEDEVIGGYDPDEILNKFNEIGQMAPRAAVQPLAMRTLLRKHLQNNTEPFEAAELSTIEKGLKDTSTNETRSILSAGNKNNAIL